MAISASFVRFRLCLIPVLALLLTVLPACATAPAAATRAARYPEPAVLGQFAARVDVAHTQRPAIEAAATAAADRVAKQPDTCLNVPYSLQASFAEELLNRAGGLANALPGEERPKLVTDHDVLILSARSWEKDQDKVREMLTKWSKPGTITILFASKAGMPADVKVDHLIDNGAADGSAQLAALNSLANVLQAWLWVCEYSSALTRHGLYPGVLYSIAMPGSTEHNAKLQKTPQGRLWLGKSEQPIAAGVLAGQYLQRVDKLLADLAAPATQEQINQAASILAAEIAAGRQVGLSTNTHFLLSEVRDDLRAPLKPFHVVWQSKKAFAANTKPGDTVLWISYIGMDTPYEAYSKAIAAAQLKVVTSYVSDRDNPANNAAGPAVLAHIEQHWQKPDAEVKVAFPPGDIAPISGLDQGLIFRMLDARIAANLAGK